MLKVLPLRDLSIEEVAVYKELAQANRALGELKGYAESIPNQHILINAMTLNEAKDSSEIEQIVTTHDELYRAMSSNSITSSQAKEVLNYRKGLWHGYEFVKKNGFIHTNILVEIHGMIEPNKGSIRKLPGTALENSATGEVIYTPPQTETEILNWLRNLEEYINNDQAEDPLIQLAFIHYQFEAIHPFYDGNGRTGRILNILFLVLKDLLNSPILYLSKYILQTKAEYYNLLRNIQENKEKAIDNWIIYILRGVRITSQETLGFVKRIIRSMDEYGQSLKEKCPKIYSKELVDTLFYEFYTRTSYVEERLGISRRTAYTYLKQLEENGFISSEKIGKERVYKNPVLFKMIEEANQE